MVEHAQTRLTITRVHVQLATQGKSVKLVNVMYKTQGPHSHILMKGGGVVRVIFLGLKFWQKVIFSVYERRWDSFWVTKKNREIFLGCEKKGLRDFFGYVKKNGDFLGIKYPKNGPPRH